MASFNKARLLTGKVWDLIADFAVALAGSALHIHVCAVLAVVRHLVPRAVRWECRPVLHLQVGTTFLVPERTGDMDGIFM